MGRKARGRFSDSAESLVDGRWGRGGEASAKAGIMRNEIVTIIIRERIYIVAG